MSGQSSAQPQVARGASPYFAVVFRASVLLAVLWNSIPALAQTVYQPPGLVREFIKVPIQFDTGEVALRMMIVRPKGPGPFPVAVLSHGTTEGIHAYLRQGVHASTYSGAAIWFARRGWAVVVPVRRGFGGSDGVFSESTGACSTDRMADARRSVAQDIRGAIDYMRRQPYVRDNEIISVGHSGGGWGSLALASDAPPGLKAIISFAGGLGAQEGHRGICNRSGLSSAATIFARTTHIPELWIYSANDQRFWPEVAHEMLTAYTEAGGKAEFFAAPAAGEDGHSFIITSMPLWSGPVEDFLRAQGLTLKPDAEVTAPKPPIDPPAGLSLVARQSFLDYQATERVDKAFALSDRGYSAWVSGRDSAEQAAADAVRECERTSKPCKAVSVDGQMVSP